MIKNLLFLLKEILNKSKSYFCVILIKNIMSAVIPIVDIMGIGVVVSLLTDHATYERIMHVILIYVIISLSLSVISAIMTGFENGVMRKSTNILQFGYMQDCVSINYHYVQDRTLLNLKPKSMGARPEFFLGLWGKCINDFIKIIGVVTIFLLTSPWFIFVMLLLALCMIKSNVWIDRKRMEYRQDKTENDRKLDYLYTVMTDYKYAKEVRINVVSKLIVGKFDEVVDHQLKKLNKMIKSIIGAESTGKILQGIQLLLVYAFFTYQFINRKITLAEYTVMVSSVTLFINSAISLCSNIGYVKNNFKAIDYLKQYYSIVKENQMNNCSSKDHVCNINYDKANIQFKNVSFKYPGTEKYILRNISCTINANERTALVGLNGAGKSTLIMLILRLYRPTDGTIFINDIDIATIPYSEYIERYSVVLQDFYLFAYSIRENIVFDMEMDERQFKKALKNSGISNRISTMDLGVETSLFKELDEKGIELSGGDAQKLALARALYKNSSIAILDEPTSSFDPIAEYDFFNKLRELSNGKTTIFVSHRLSSTIFCDKILVLKDGRLIEEGNHNELMENDGEYKTLFMFQAQYYEKGGIDKYA